VINGSIATIEFVPFGGITIWQYVESLDLSELYGTMKATADNVGRSPIDPRIVFALWLVATIEGTHIRPSDR
jgi:hypothetical protein